MNFVVSVLPAPLSPLREATKVKSSSYTEGGNKSRVKLIYVHVCIIIRCANMAIFFGMEFIDLATSFIVLYPALNKVS